MLSNLLAMNWLTMELICIPCLVISALCAIFVIVVVMIQPSNSSGISALGGQQETFYGKNKGKSLEHKLRKLTVIAVSVMAVFMIVFCAVVFHFDF